MALSDITPAVVISETTAAKKTASAILALAVYVDTHVSELWDLYGVTWHALGSQQQNAVITAIAKEAGVVVNAVLLTWFRTFLDLCIGERYKDDLIEKLQVQEAQLTAKLAAIRAEIDKLTTP
jgi:hypothetical protein